MIVGCTALIVGWLACAPAASERDEALEIQLAELEDLLDVEGGHLALERELESLRQAVEDRVKAHRGHRSEMRVGDMVYNSEICQAAIRPDWLLPPPEVEERGDPLEILVDFDRQLKALGVDLIVVPVPSKIEAYSENFGPVPPGVPVSLGRTQFMIELLRQDVEVIDVLPDIQDAMVEEELPLYETVYHHLSGVGARIAGEVVAQRLGRFEVSGADKERYTYVERATHERHHPDVPMRAFQVVDRQGKPYQPSDRSNILIVGDSNVFAHGSASWGSHIGRALGKALSEDAVPGGGPTAHRRLADRGGRALAELDAVVWILTSSHIPRKRWEGVTIPERATPMGMIRGGRSLEVLELLNDERSRRPSLDEDAVYGLAEQALAVGDNDEAERLFLINAMAHPGSFDAQYRLGEVQERGGDEEGARSSYRRSLELNPLGEGARGGLQRLGETPPKARGVQLSSERLDRLCGEYRLSERSTLRVTRQGEGLRVSFSRGPTLDPLAVTDTCFVTDRDIVFDFEFSDGASEAASRVVVTVTRRRQVAPRIEAGS